MTNTEAAAALVPAAEKAARDAEYAEAWGAAPALTVRAYAKLAALREIVAGADVEEIARVAAVNIERGCCNPREDWQAEGRADAAREVVAV